MKERVFIIIDGSNFYHRLKELEIKNLLKFDYKKFGEFLTGKRKIALKRYYIGDIAYEVPLQKDDEGDLVSIYPASLEIIAEAEKFGLVCSNCGHKTKPLVTSSYVLVPFDE